MFEFIKENILLVGLALGSGFALLWPLLQRSASGATMVSASEAVMLLNRSKVLVLDVRDANEFSEGHIQGAKHIPLAELGQRWEEVQKFKDKPVLVHCQKGMRARTACTLLKGQGYTQVYQLMGGLDAWLEAKLPVVKSSH